VFVALDCGLLDAEGSREVVVSACWLLGAEDSRGFANTSPGLATCLSRTTPKSTFGCLFHFVVISPSWKADPFQYHETAGPIHVEDRPSLAREAPLAVVYIVYLGTVGYPNSS
jgi:hypothetical protein